MQKHFPMLFLVSLAIGGTGCDRDSSFPKEGTPGEISASVPTPDEIASPAPSQPSSPTRHPSTPSQFQNRCQDEETAFVFAETQDYWLNICGKFAPEFLIAVLKQEQILTRLPVTDYNLAEKWFEATDIEREYVLGFQGRFEGDIFFVITQLKPDRANKPKYFRELIQQPLLQVQAHLTPPSTPIAVRISSPLGVYQSEGYTLTLEESDSTVSYRGCTSENQCIFIPQVSTRDRDRFVWQQDNATYIFFPREENNRYQLQILDGEGQIVSDRILNAVSEP